VGASSCPHASLALANENRLLDRDYSIKAARSLLLPSADKSRAVVTGTYGIEDALAPVMSLLQQ
jgi:hypothetical protein